MSNVMDIDFVVIVTHLFDSETLVRLGLREKVGKLLAVVCCAQLKLF